MRWCRSSNNKALGGVAGIVGAGGNVGAVLAGFLMKGTGDVGQTTLTILSCAASSLVAAVCAIAVRFSNLTVESPTTPPPHDYFVGWARRARHAVQEKQHEDLIVIGHGMVGHKFR